jgi:hypothetical protein
VSTRVGTPMYSGQLSLARVPGVMMTSRTEIDPVPGPWPSKTPVGEADDDYFYARNAIPGTTALNYDGWDHGLDP